ncbi:MAG: hypothetical protein IPJ06_08560 [Saprospiraceae bacterium]|nr:hypothetical protein [Saprospiraceae bacterium]
MNQLAKGSTDMNHAFTISRKALVIFSLLTVGTLGGNSALYCQVVSALKAVDAPSHLTGNFIAYSIDFGCSSLVGDCDSAYIVDYLPPEVTFNNASPVIVNTTSGPQAVTATYDAMLHALIWDFRTLPGASLMAGASGTINITVQLIPCHSQ